jgi:hypothetical protein
VVTTDQTSASPAITAADTSTANEEPSTTMWVGIAAMVVILAGTAVDLPGALPPQQPQPHPDPGQRQGQHRLLIVHAITFSDSAEVHHRSHSKVTIITLGPKISWWAITHS